MNCSAHTSTLAIAACTAAAAHRRDHEHRPHDECHPHVVEVVRLGTLGVAVCHDCGIDSGFIAAREADALCVAHRRNTVTASVALPRPQAA
jgi:hypothetical protein